MNEDRTLQELMDKANQEKMRYEDEILTLKASHHIQNSINNVLGQLEILPCQLVQCFYQYAPLHED